MRNFYLIAILFLCFRLDAQEFKNLKKIHPDGDYDNIVSKKIAGDSLQTVFLIWIKKEVKAHFHRDHSENIIVLEGRALMVIKDSVFKIRKGDFISIPKGTIHSVRAVKSKRPLKVISIQSPFFDGTDRVFIKE